MGWMWVLPAVLVVLVVAGVLVSRRRGGTGESGPEVTGTPDTAEVPEGPDPGRDPGTVGLFDTAGAVDPSAAAAGAHTPSPDVAPSPSSADGAGEWSGPGATSGGPTGNRDAPGGHGLSGGTEADPAPGTRPADVAPGATATTPDLSGPEASGRGADGDGADGDGVTAGGTGPGDDDRPTTDGVAALSQDGADHDGAAPDGESHDGAAADGAVHDGPADDGAAGSVPVTGEPSSAATTTDAAATTDAATTADAATGPAVPRPRPESDPAPPDGSAEDDEPAGRHALRDDVEPAPLPEPGPAPADDGPPAPLPIPSRPRQGAGGSALAALDSMIIGPSAASAPLPPGVRPGPYPDSVLAPTDGGDPPETHRVKVHSGSRRFHPPESPYYVRTRADLYFTAEGAARAAGFIAWHERPGAR
ncbi:hypothetical protein ACIGG9_00275 [Pseudonocardia alni]|uniref:sunset domain-containing protein n=1 Tax=Pseudonocardia alni TaxID=33907 RepID=UPI0033FCA849